MQDMHDGFGGNLYGLIAQVRGKTVSYDNLADALQTCLDELRLIVDSLDSAGDDLGMALGTFRARIEGRLKQAGISLKWYIDPEVGSMELSATQVLQIYRILQEACTNAVRHSGCDEISISLQPDESPRYRGVLEITDNGSGFDQQETPSGRGVGNMSARAEHLGGELIISSNDEGTRLTLNLPSRKLS